MLVELTEEGVDALDVPTYEAESHSAAPPAQGAPPAVSPQAPPTAPDRADLSLRREGPDWGPSPSLEDVRNVLGNCERCELCGGRQNIVFGSGNPDADLVFVGEGPGEQEDRQGLPFVGRAGELLTQMIEKGIDIPRSDVYICNIVKCRPPGNRNPKPDEVAACQPFLDGQIAAVKPKVIVTLGKPAASLLLGREVPITRVRGTWHEYQGIALMPTLHPAYILRQYTPENRRLVWEDLKAAVARMREPSRPGR
ncbi:MAG: uracil-DNA glycosylase [bacterium]|nr:uracil-DNA glycosylase [bacterium]